MKPSCLGIWLALMVGSSMVLSAAPAETALPKLTGIVRLEQRKVALLEWDRLNRPPAGYLLAEGESVSGCEVTAIDERTGRVTVRHRPTDQTVTLKLDQAGEELANRTFQFQAAKLELVLEVYQRLSGRTVIPSPQLPQASLDLKSGPALAAAEAVKLLDQALAAKGVTMKPAGDKFVFAVPADQAPQLAAIPPPPTAAISGGETFPPGLLKFTQADLLQALDIYAELSSRTVLTPNNLPVGKITVRSQTPLTRTEAIWLMGASLSVAGVAMVPESDKFVFAVPLSRTNGLPHFDPQAAAAKAKKAAPPGTIRLAGADPEKLLALYAAVLGREPLPVEPQTPRARVSLRSPKELGQPEAIFALEAVAALHNLRLELVGADQVRIIPAAAAR